MGALELEVVISFSFVFLYLASWRPVKFLLRSNPGLKISMDWETLILSLRTNQ